MSKKQKSKGSTDTNPKRMRVSKPSILQWNERVAEFITRALYDGIPVSPLCRLVTEYSLWKPDVNSLHNCHELSDFPSLDSKCVLLSVHTRTLNCVMVDATGDTSFGLYRMSSSGAAMQRMIKDPVDRNRSFGMSRYGVFSFANGVQRGCVAGHPGWNAGFADGKGFDAAFNDLTSIVCRSDGKLLFLCDSENHRIRTVDPTTDIVSTLCGNGASRDVDGYGIKSELYSPFDMVMYRGPLHPRDSKLYITCYRRDARLRCVDVNSGLLTTIVNRDLVSGGSFIECTPTGILVLCSLIHGSVQLMDPITGFVFTLQMADDDHKTDDYDNGTYIHVKSSGGITVSDAHESVFVSCATFVQRVVLPSHLFVG